MYFGELEGEGHMSPSWTGSDFKHYRCSRSFSYWSLRIGRWKSRVGRRFFNILNSSWCSWANEDLDHECGSSGFTCRLFNWLSAGASVD